MIDKDHYHKVVKSNKECFAYIEVLKKEIIRRQEIINKLLEEKEKAKEDNWI